MPKFLTLFRTGSNSLHGNFVSQPRSWDFAISSFVESPPAVEDAVFVDIVPGPKWTGLAATIRKHRAVIESYDYVWLPDDDLLTDQATVDRLFAFAEKFEFEMCQPALTLDSYRSHLITVRHAVFHFRLTNYVELMAPLFSRTFLMQVLPTFDGTISGWGLDLVWPRLTSLGKIAIIDSAPVKHTRPIGGPSYALSKEAGVTAYQEYERVAAIRFLDQRIGEFLNYGGQLADGRGIAMDAGKEAINQLLSALQESVKPMRVSPLAMVQYLQSHVAFWEGSPLKAAPYSRDEIRRAIAGIVGLS